MKHTVYLSYKGAYGLAVLPGNSFIKLTLAGCQRNQTVQISYGPHAAHGYRVRKVQNALRWHSSLSAKVTKNANLGYSHDRGLS